MSALNPHVQTISALDEMEENLRRLGLGHAAAVDPLKNSNASASERSTAYMASIRAAKEERRKLRVDKEYRQYMATQHQQAESTQTLSDAAESRAVHAAAVDGAAALLQEETSAATAVSRRRQNEEAAQLARGDQVSCSQKLEKQLLAKRACLLNPPSLDADSKSSPDGFSTRSSGTRKTLVAPSASDCEHIPVPSALQPSGNASRHTAVQDFCHSLVTGVAELAVCVSDSRFLPTATDVSGNPVRRVQQDMPVTQWRAWVKQFLWDAATSSPDGHAADKDGDVRIVDGLDATGRSRPSSTLGHLEETDADAAAARAAIGHVAQEQISTAAALQQRHEDELRCDAVAQCFELLRKESERVSKSVFEDIRRSSDEAETAAAQGMAADGAVSDGVARESKATAGEQAETGAGGKEVYPGWAQRMLPAGCLLFGDELSGTRLLCDTVEKVTQSGNDNGGGVPTAVQQRRASQYSEDVGSVSGRGNGHDSRRASVHAASTHGGASSQAIGLVRLEGGVQRTYVTPRTLLHTVPAMGFGAGSRAHSAGRGTRVAVATVKPGAAGGVPPTATANEEEEQREYEVLAEALAKELVAVHVHNLHVGTQGRTPATVTAALAARSLPRTSSVLTSKSQRSRAEVAREEPGDSQKDVCLPHPPSTLQLPPPHTLTLIGFPPSKTFNQLLQQKLNVLLDNAELSILEQQEQQRLAKEAAAAAAELAEQQASAGPARGQRTKSAPHVSTQGNASPGKAKPSTKAEPSAHTTLSSPDTGAADSLHRLRQQTFFPPLCVVGCFLDCHLPELHQRLVGAYRRVPAQGSSGELPLPTPVLFHDVYGPEVLLAVSTGSSRDDKSLARTGSNCGAATTVAGLATAQVLARRTVAAANAAAAEPHVAAVVGNNDSSKTERLREWPVSRLRTELEEHQARWRRLQEQWCNSFLDLTAAPPASSIADPTVLAAGTTPGGADSFIGLGAKDSKSKRRRNPPGSNEPGPGSSPLLQPSPVLDDGAPGLCTGAAGFQFPKVLFFCRSCDPNEEPVDDSDTPLGVEEPSLYSFRSDSRECDEERVRVLRRLCTAVATATATTKAAATATVSTRVFTGEALAAHQLSPPLRLSDYRRSPQVCSALTRAHRACVECLAIPKNAGQVPPDSQGADASAGDVRAKSALLAEAELFRAFDIYVWNVFLTVSRDAFPASLWRDATAPGVVPVPPAADELNSTAHFNSIDGSYEMARRRVQALQAEFLARIQQRVVLWWQQLLENSLRSTASVLEALCSSVLSAQGKPSAASGAAVDCGTSFMENARRINAEEAERLAALVVAVPDCVNDVPADTVAPSTLASQLWQLLDPFLRGAHAAAAEALTRALASASSETLTITFATESDPRATAVMIDWAAMAPALVDCALCRTLALSEAASSAPAVPPAKGPASRTECSPYLARAAVVTQELVGCLHRANERAEQWLQTMYGVALAVPPGESFPTARGHRPTSVAEFFEQPPSFDTEYAMQLSAYAQDSWSPSAGSRQSAPQCTWSRLNFLLYVSALSLHNRAELSEDEFVHVHILAQLPQLWRSLTDTSAARADALGVAAPAALPSPLVETEAPPSDAFWLSSFFTSSPCRQACPASPAARPPSFLATDELRRLAQHYRQRDAHGGPTMVGLSPFLRAVVLRQSCLCGRNPLECPWQRACAVPEPSPRELRRTVATLPACVRQQATLQPLDSTEHVINATDTEIAEAREWAGVAWWPPHTGATVAAPSARFVAGALPWTLRQVFTAEFALGKAGVLRAAHPPLPVVLRAVSQSSCGGALSIERMFHAIAAVRHSLTAAREPASGAVAELSSALEATAVALTVQEFCFFFADCEHASSGGALPSAIPLNDDAVLLFEHARTRCGKGSSTAPAGPVAPRVMLSDLLATHWGRALIAAHFA